MYFDISRISFIIIALKKFSMADDKDKKGGLFGLGSGDANDNDVPEVLDVQLDDIPAKSSRRLKSGVPQPIDQARSDQHADLLLNVIPDHLHAPMTKLSRGYHVINDELVDIFVHLGDAGVNLVTDLKFLQEQNKISVLKQDLILLRTFLVKFKQACEEDYRVDPLPLLAKLVKSRPDLSLIDVLETAQSCVGKLLNMSYPARLQFDLVDLDWSLSELSIFLQNWEMINRQDSRQEGFRYVRIYLESAKEKGKFDRDNLQ